MTLKTSLVIGGDAQGAIAAAHGAEASLDGVATAAKRASAANDQLAASSVKASGAARAGYTNLGRQVSDIQVQLQGGANIGQIIAQQGGQVADAVAQMGGRFSGFARFLAGPWGAAVIAGGSLLATFAAGMFSAGDESDKLKTKSMSLHDALLQVGKGSEEARKALVEYNAEQDRARKSTDSMIKLNLANAEAKLKDAIATREQIKAEYDRQKAFASDPRNFSGDGDANSQSFVVGGLKTNLDEQDKKIAELRSTANNLGIQNAARDAKAAVDPIEAIKNKYDDLSAAAIRAAAGNAKLTQSLTGTLTAYNRQRDAELDAQRAADRRAGARPKADPYAGRDMGEFGSPVPGAGITSGYGTRVAPTKGASTNHLGVDYAAREGTPVYATQDGLVDFAARRGGYGNQIGINHGGGTESRYSHLSRFAVGDGQEVTKGQVIGYSGSTGTVTGPHLHYEVLVNGKKVDPTKGRFPIDASAVAAEADKAADALEKFGEQATDKIARINGQWDSQPRLIDAASNSTRELDRTIEELQKKNLGGIFDGQIAAAQAAKQTIQEGLLRPFEQLKEDSNKRLQTERLITAGMEDEARALEIITQFEERNYDLNVAQKQAILEQVRHEREVTEELQRRQGLLGQYLDTTRSIKQELVSIFAGNGSVANLAKIGQQLNSQMLVEKLFGPAFKDLDSWVKDQSGIKPSVEFLTTETTHAGNALSSLADAVAIATQRILHPEATPGTSLESSFDQTFGSKGKVGIGALGATAVAIGSALAQSGGGTAELKVTGTNSVFALTPNQYFDKMGHSMAGTIVDALNSEFDTKFFSKFEGVLSGGIKGYLTAGPIGGALGALQAIPGLPKGIADQLSKALGGAQTGAMVQGVAGAFGIKLNSTGSTIGGALGGLTGIPGGSIIGSIAGGIIGNLFGTRPRGGATVSNSGVNAHANTGDITSSLNDTGSNLQGVIAQIAGSLGASVGNYSIGIGRYKDYYQVSNSGSDPRLGNSYFGRDSKNALYDGLDPAAAMKAALAGAIGQGAIKGISAAMQKALASSTDVQAAVNEALKVHEVELAIGGIGAQLADQLKAFEKQAAERLRVAKQYGFDVVKIEEKNAEDRTKLLKDMLASQVGSLQQLIDDMTSGSLFEGSAVDQRQILLGKISAAKAEADKGTAGAADTLAQLLTQLNAVSKDAFGTTGGFAEDRTTILDAARDSIAKANQRIADAQAASDPALAETNASFDENNAQNAQIIGQLDMATNLLAQIAALGGVTQGSLSDLARTSTTVQG